MKADGSFSSRRMMFGGGLLVLAVISAVSCVAAEKVIIAHRGASGYLPEHSLPGYAMAYGMGADYLEPDLAMTRDKVLICLHDLTLEGTTNVAEVFPDRKREDGKWYAADFTVEEIRRLHLVERLPKRFPKAFPLLCPPTFEEFLQLVQGLNTSTGSNVGIYPEIKDPGFYQKEGLPFVETALELLAKYGYEGPRANLYIQCFSPATLKKMRNEMGVILPMVHLTSDEKDMTAERLAEIAVYAQGIGPDKKLIEKDPGLVQRAHAAGLVVHPYTFRADIFPKRYASAEEEIRAFLFEYGVDGGFTDHTDVMKRVRDEQRQ